LHRNWAVIGGQCTKSERGNVQIWCVLRQNIVATRHGHSGWLFAKLKPKGHDNRKERTMLSQKLFEDISNKISETIAASPAKDLEKNIKSMMASTFSRMDLVTREEFDVQQEVLARTREKLVLLEARLAKLEAVTFPEALAEQEADQASQGHS